MTLTDRNPRASRILLALPVAALAFSLAACGGSARPTADQVSDGLDEFFTSQGQTLPDGAADCFAGYLVDSELSDETLTYLANGEDKQKNEEEKALTTKIVTDNRDECLAAD